MCQIKIKLTNPTLTLFSGCTAVHELDADTAIISEILEENTTIGLDSEDSIKAVCTGSITITNIPRELQDYVFNMVTVPTDIMLSGNFTTIDVYNCQITKWSGEWNGEYKTYKLIFKASDFKIER